MSFKQGSLRQQDASARGQRPFETGVKDEPFADFELTGVVKLSLDSKETGVRPRNAFSHTWVQQLSREAGHQAR